MFNLFTEWKKCKDVFRKPRLAHYFGPWRSDPTLPVWRRPNEFHFFYFFNIDIVWKTKWDSIRFEFPPSVTFVFFGLSFSIWSVCPVQDKYGFNNLCYFESMLEYNYNCKDKSINGLKKFILSQGFYSGVDNKATPVIDKSFLNSKYLDIYYEAIAEMKNNNLSYKWAL